MTAHDMTGMKHRVLIVDDSRSIRAWLKYVLDQDPTLEVVGEAADAAEAAKRMRDLSPDIMTLDVEMPGKSGLDYLREVMSDTPLPVVMFSSLTSRGSQAAITALTNGAVDCIVKPAHGATEQEARMLRRRVRAAARATVKQLPERCSKPRRPAQRTAMCGSRASAPILLGSSTGGVGALEVVLEALEGTPCPVVIAQHMPEKFLNSFCNRLNDTYERNFVMAEDGMPLEPGLGVMGSGLQGSTHLVATTSGWVCKLAPSLRKTPYHPCVDDLFETAAQQTKLPVAAAALLTGMGRDGAEGLLKLRDRGVHTIAQNEATSTVYGMPRAAVELNAACEVLPLEAIGGHLAQAAANAPRSTGRSQLI